MKVNSEPVSLTIVASMCPCTTQPMLLILRTSLLSRTATLLRKSWRRVRMPRA